MTTLSNRIRWAAAAALLLAACAPAAAPTAAPTAEPQVIEVTRVVAGTPEVQVITATPPPAAPAETFRVAIVSPSSITDIRVMSTSTRKRGRSFKRASSSRFLKSRSLRTGCGMLPRFTYELARRAVQDARIAEVGVLGDEDAVLRVGEARDVLVRGMPALRKAVHVLAVMTGFGEALAELDGDMDVAEEAHHATSPSE